MILTLAEARAVLAIAAEVDFVGAREFARLSAEEAEAWAVVVRAARDKIERYDANRRLVSPTREGA